MDPVDSDEYSGDEEYEEEEEEEESDADTVVEEVEDNDPVVVQHDRVRIVDQPFPIKGSIPLKAKRFYR